MIYANFKQLFSIFILLEWGGYVLYGNSMTNNNIMGKLSRGIRSYILYTKKKIRTEWYIDYCRDLIMDPVHWLP